MVVYSFSQINLFEQCPKKYQYRYIDGLEREFESSPDLILGTSVHGALERLYQQVSIFNIPIKADVLGKFHELRNREIGEVGEKLIYKGNQYEEDYLRRGEKYLSAYYDKYYPFSDSKIVSTEMLLNFSLNKENQGGDKQFRGIIDRLDKDEKGGFIINDYKTNKNLPPEDKNEYQDQLTLYAHGVQQKYGKYFDTIKARLYYLHFEIVDERDINQEQIDKVLEKYTSAIDKIEHARFEYNMGYSRAFPTKQNAYCKYCEYHNLCPLWQHEIFEDEKISAGDLGESSIKSLVDKYIALSNTIIESTKEKEMIKDILVEYAEKKGFDQLFGQIDSITVTKGEMYSIKDKDDFKNFLKENGLLEEVIDIPYYKVNELVKKGKISDSDKSKFLEKKDSWRLNISKNKKEELEE